MVCYGNNNLFGYWNDLIHAPNSQLSVQFLPCFAPNSNFEYHPANFYSKPNEYFNLKENNKILIMVFQIVDIKTQRYLF